MKYDLTPLANLLEYEISPSELASELDEILFFYAINSTESPTLKAEDHVKHLHTLYTLKKILKQL